MRWRELPGSGSLPTARRATRRLLGRLSDQTLRSGERTEAKKSIDRREWHSVVARRNRSPLARQRGTGRIPSEPLRRSAGYPARFPEFENPRLFGLLLDSMKYFGLKPSVFATADNRHSCGSAWLVTSLCPQFRSGPAANLYPCWIVQLANASFAWRTHFRPPLFRQFAI